jgi:uncharacterized protein
MSLIYYNAEKGVALADDPLSLGQEPEGNLCPDPVEVDELGAYFIRFFDPGDENEQWLDRAGFLKKDRVYPGRLQELSFLNRMGLTRIGPIKIIIRSRKLSEEGYRSVLDYIGEKFANLVFSFGTPSGENYRKDQPGSDIPYIEFLFLDRFLLGSPLQLDMISGLILSEPHRKLSRQYLMRPPDAVRSAASTVIENMLTAAHCFVPIDPRRSIAGTSLARRFEKKTGRCFFLSEVYCEEKFNTFDTNENRFIKFVLDHLAKRMTTLQKTLSDRNLGYLNPDIESKLSLLDQKLSCFLSAPLWKDVGNMTHAPANSQVLQKKDGYRQLFRLHCLLYLLSRCDFEARDFENILETKDIPTLYEYWCFFVVKDILDHQAQPVSAQPFVQFDAVQQKLIMGFRIDYSNGATLWFNRTYASPIESYSHELIPDIAITFNSREMILDAKFKGADENGEIAKFVTADIDKMHAYRDALAEVEGAFILYPGNKIEPDLFRAHGGKSEYDGVGAFSLKPGKSGKPNESQVTEVAKAIRKFLCVNSL